MELPPAIENSLGIVRNQLSECRSSDTQEKAFQGMLTSMESLLLAVTTLAQHCFLSFQKAEGTVHDLSTKVE